MVAEPLWSRVALGLSRSLPMHPFSPSEQSGQPVTSMVGRDLEPRHRRGKPGLYRSARSRGNLQYANPAALDDCGATARRRTRSNPGHSPGPTKPRKPSRPGFTPRGFQGDTLQSLAPGQHGRETLLGRGDLAHARRRWRADRLARFFSRYHRPGSGEGGAQPVQSGTGPPAEEPLRAGQRPRHPLCAQSAVGAGLMHAPYAIGSAAWPGRWIISTRPD